MKIHKSKFGNLLSWAWVLTGLSLGHGASVVTGTLKLWYPVTVTFDGPAVSEASTTFRNNRLDVTFTHGAKSIKALGYFAADGDAGESGAIAGNKWRVKFTPNLPGAWSFKASFKMGPDIAASLDPAAGTAAAPDGETGSFTVTPADPGAPGFYSKGLLKYVGEHYLQFEGSKEWYIKGGAGSPENLFGYFEFDGTIDKGGLGPATASSLHEWPKHVADWKVGDPTWKGGKGKGIIGAMNYLASRGVNSQYLIPMGVNGDAKDSWPWTSDLLRDVYDVSKLDQWEIVLRHMDAIGINKDYYFWEMENTRLIANGALDATRKIYYRELVARFSHILAIHWNIGEEPTHTFDQIAADIEFVNILDPYDHGVGVHNQVPEAQRTAQYTALLGKPGMDGAWTQIHSDFYNQTLMWIAKSKAAGHKWVVSLDETTAKNPGTQDAARVEFWENTMAGGEGEDIYFGYGGNVGDCDDEDFRGREGTWDLMSTGVKFWMSKYVNRHLGRNGGVIASNNLGTGHILANESVPDDAAYIVKGNGGMLNMAKATGVYNVYWYDTKVGGAFKQTAVTTVTGGATVNLGAPPSAGEWAIIVTKDPSTGNLKNAQMDNQDFGLTIHASPGNTLTLNYSLSLASSVTIDLINVRGEITSSPLKHALENAGKHARFLNASHLTSGIHFIRIKLETKTGKREFMRPLPI
jgi:hypothetical protein